MAVQRNRDRQVADRRENAAENGTNIYVIYDMISRR
jgi:hypothetical protein